MGAQTSSHSLANNRKTKSQRRKRPLRARSLSPYFFHNPNLSSATETQLKTFDFIRTNQQALLNRVESFDDEGEN